MAVLWEEWLGASEKWSSSKYVLTLSKQHTHEKIGARRWMTRKLLVEKCGDETIADDIIETKKANEQLAATQIKRHPDAPHRDEPRLRCIRHADPSRSCCCS